MARRKIFTPFSVSLITGESKEEAHTVSPPHTAKRISNRSCRDTYMLFQPIKKLSGEEK
jgi:hypothetical protein